MKNQFWLTIWSVLYPLVTNAPRIPGHDKESCSLLGRWRCLGGEEFSLCPGIWRCSEWYCSEWYLVSDTSLAFYSKDIRNLHFLECRLLFLPCPLVIALWIHSASSHLTSASSLPPTCPWLLPFHLPNSYPPFRSELSVFSFRSFSSVQSQSGLGASPASATAPFASP